MTKQLVMDALQDAINHTNNIEGCILHSDRGSQYCSKAYQQMIYQKTYRQQHEPQRELLGQRSHGKLLGYVEARMVKRPALPYTR